ncbi:MAG: nucleoside recognition protein [bacterium]|nr:nucleoside recognition protein [bacterium]
MLLWFQTVLPTLFPFLFASKLAVWTGGSRYISRPLLPLFSNCFGLGEEGSYSFFCGLLCGCPMGAKTCSDFLDEGKLTTAQARFLVALSNLPSPMFLLGYVAGEELPAWLLLWSVYGPLLPLSILARRIYLCPSSAFLTPSPQRMSQQNLASPPILETLLADCCQVLVTIGAYMMLFSVAAAFVARLSFLPPFLRVLPIGLLEMTTGVQAARSLPRPLSSFCLLLFPVFGGLCALFQTKSAMKNAGLSIRHYVFWKLLHTAISSLYFFLGIGLQSHLLLL